MSPRPKTELPRLENGNDITPGLASMGAGRTGNPGFSTCFAFGNNHHGHNSDSGTGSLRAAITSASSGDTIDFSLAYPATTTLASTLTITQDLTDQRSGPANLVISGNNSVRVFLINGDNRIHLRPDHRERKRLLGGGIHIYSDGTLTVNNSTVSGNIGGNYYDGGQCGGISNGGTLTVTNTLSAPLCLQRRRDLQPCNVNHDRQHPLDNFAFANGGGI